MKDAPTVIHSVHPQPRTESLINMLLLYTINTGLFTRLVAVSTDFYTPSDFLQRFLACLLHYGQFCVQYLPYGSDTEQGRTSMRPCPTTTSFLPVRSSLRLGITLHVVDILHLVYFPLSKCKFRTMCYG